MLSTEEKIGRMVDVARMYYEQNKSQNEIAKALGISRPLVSLLLTEAKNTGIVKIKINDLRTTNDALARSLRDRFWLRNVTVITNNDNPNFKTDEAVALTAYAECFKKNNLGKAVGIGWGSMLGKMVEYAETLDDAKPGRGLIFPLAGGIHSVIKGYHINELVRVFSLKTGKQAVFLYLPALYDTEEELDLSLNTEAYEEISGEWDTMEQAIISISNFPSYPDLGVKSIYGDKLTKEHAVGRILAYYFDENGNIIDPQIHTTMQASLEQLKRADVTAVCSKGVKTSALLGALRLRVIDNLVVPFELANRLMDTL